MPIQPKPQPPYYVPTTGETSGTKEYVALLNQTGTNHATATVIKNTFTGTPTWTRDGTGYYIIEITGELIPTKTIIQITPSKTSGILGAQEEDTNNSFAIFQNDYSGSNVDNMINQPITITVYP